MLAARTTCRLVRGLLESAVAACAANDNDEDELAAWSMMGAGRRGECRRRSGGRRLPWPLRHSGVVPCCSCKLADARAASIVAETTQQRTQALENCATHASAVAVNFENMGRSLQQCFY